MKKLFSMILVLSTIVFAVSCAADDATDDGGTTPPTSDTVAKQKAITVAGGVNFTAEGAGTGTVTQMGTGTVFKAAFLTGANNAYGSEYDDIKSGDISINTDPTDSAFTKDTEYIITLKVALKADKDADRVESFMYKITPTDIDTITDDDVDYSFTTTEITLTDVTFTDGPFVIVDGINNTATTLLVATLSSTGSATKQDLADAIAISLNADTAVTGVATTGGNEIDVTVMSGSEQIGTGGAITFSVILKAKDGYQFENTGSDTGGAGTTKTVTVVVTGTKTPKTIADDDVDYSFTTTEITLMDVGFTGGPFVIVDGINNTATTLLVATLSNSGSATKQDLADAIAISLNADTAVTGVATTGGNEIDVTVTNGGDQIAAGAITFSVILKAKDGYQFENTGSDTGGAGTTKTVTVVVTGAKL